MNCALCDKEIEGENLILEPFDGFILYREKMPNGSLLIRHNCKTARFHKLKVQKETRNKAEDALRALALRPNSKKAQAAVKDAQEGMLWDVVRSGNRRDSGVAMRKIQAIIDDEAPEAPYEPPEAPEFYVEAPDWKQDYKIELDEQPEEFYPYDDRADVDDIETEPEEDVDDLEEEEEATPPRVGSVVYVFPDGSMAPKRSAAEMRNRQYPNPFNIRGLSG